MFLGLLDTDPLVKGMDSDPDPSFYHHFFMTFYL
jgi:hypothetical protein